MAGACQVRAAAHRRANVFTNYLCKFLHILVYTIAFLVRFGIIHPQ